FAKIAVMAMVLVMVMVLAAAGSGAPVSAAAPATVSRLSVQPRHGPPTARVTVHGTGFQPGAQVTLTFGDTPVGHVDTGADGASAVRVTVPETARPGIHAIDGSDPFGDHATTSFLVRTEWGVFRFDHRHVGVNPYENVLTPTTVRRLRLRWQVSTG